MAEIGSLISDILSRRDPHGYFVIPLDSDKAKDVLEGLDLEGVKFIYANDTVLVKTRSRSLAQRILRRAIRLNALVLEF